MQWGELIGPWLCVIGLALAYALAFRLLLRRRVPAGLACLAFVGTVIAVVLAVMGFYLLPIRASFTSSLMAEFQAATGFRAMFRLALLYAGLPEEAVKIGVVVLLLVLLPGRLRHRSVPAELLLYSALGFAMTESLLYVAGFSLMPQVKEHLVAFALMRGLFGGLLHALLGMVAGYALAVSWQTSWRLLGIGAAYVVAVLLHAGFDGSLLHVVFESMSGRSGNLVVDAGPAVAPFLASSVTLLVLAVGGIWSSRRLSEAPDAVTVPDK